MGFTGIPLVKGRFGMSDSRPNIVFVLVDNCGWGDFACYGGGTATPRIDKLASEGIRFTNYSVEAQCTPTRSAILTGRQSVRSGTFTVPLPGQGKSGLAPWEYTIAELLSDAGYETALFGKWHCGDVEGRLPTDQGFDEWWGYRNSADEAGWTSYAMFNAIAKLRGLQPPQLWEGTKGGKQTAVADLDMAVRPFLDEKIVGKTTDYIKRKAASGKPFFTYVGLSHFHPPEAVHPDFDQTSPDRLSAYADIVAEIDHRLGQIIDCVEEAGIADDTLIVFSTDNAATPYNQIHQMQGGSNGPFRGSFMDLPWEGSYRTPAIVRWPGTVPAGVVTDQMLSCHDWYTTFAALAGASDRVPDDRPIDGIDASKFLLGQSEATGRETLLHFGPDGELWSSKWRNIKCVLKYSNGIDAPIVKPQFPMMFDLASDPSESVNLFASKMDMGWMFGCAFAPIGEYRKSIAEYPNIKTGEDFAGYGKAKAKKKPVAA